MDGKTLGGVAHHHHYGIAHPAGGMVDFLAADDRQGADTACECRRRRLSGLACPQDAGIPRYWHCEMIFISVETPDSVVFFAALKPPSRFGDLMKKSATLITTALLTFGFVAASMAADAPPPAAPTADAAAPAPAAAAKSAKHSKKHKKATTAPATTK